VARLHRLAPLGIALAGGFLWAFQFGERPFVVAPFVALAPLLLLLGARQPGRLGWAHGLAYWLAAIPWIAPTLVSFGHLPWAVAVLLLVLLAAYLGAFTALFAWLGAPLWRHASAWVPLATLPALWVALEWLRGVLLTGFPWNLAAYAWLEVPGALPLAAWIGPWGISFLVLWANTGVAMAAARRRWELAAVGLLAPLLVLAVGGRWAGPTTPSLHPAGEPVRVVQPNVPILEDPWGDEVLEAYRRVFDLSRSACDQAGALVVWPESAGWPYAFPRDPGFARDLAELLEEGCPLVLNSPFETPAGTTNAAFLLTPHAELPHVEARYDKRHLVPFGEYVPVRRFLPFVDSLARGVGDFVAGQEVALLPWGRERLGMSICFEIVFPGEVAELVRGGATALVTITNDAWYGDTAAPWQHHRAARFRAAENRRPLLRAAITGVSGLVEADGSTVAELGVFEEGILRTGLRGREDLTPFTRHPNLVPALCGLLAMGGLGWALAGRRRGARPL
jgi:apolipoprotein N-acyltransferase